MLIQKTTLALTSMPIILTSLSPKSEIFTKCLQENIFLGLKLMGEIIKKKILCICAKIRNVYACKINKN